MFKKLFARQPPQKPEPVTGYIFKPAPDITAYELAMILANFRGENRRPIGEGFTMPSSEPIEVGLSRLGIPEASRHFERIGE